MQEIKDLTFCLAWSAFLLGAAFISSLVSFSVMQNLFIFLVSIAVSIIAALFVMRYVFKIEDALKCVEYALQIEEDLQKQPIPITKVSGNLESR